MSDNENKKSNEKVEKKPIAKEIKNSDNKKVETSGNYFTGIIGAIIGGAIGAVPWIIAYIYGNMMIALLAILIAGGAYYGYKLFKGKITKKSNNNYNNYIYNYCCSSNITNNTSHTYTYRRYEYKYGNNTVFISR